MPSFLERLGHLQATKRSRLCVGLDPDPLRLPPHLLQSRALPEAVLHYNCAIIDATAASACAFKLNFAFFEALGAEGWRVLKATIDHIPDDVLIIADAKRGDIGNSARFYATSVFEQLGCDAITVAPYMGRDSVLPFLQYEGTAAFVLGRTSNPGAADFQEPLCGDQPLFVRVSRQVSRWAETAPGTAGLVVGATDIHALKTIRTLCPTTPFLIPGVGAQGGDAASVLTASATDQGHIIVNSSRGIIYASSDPTFAEVAAREAESLRHTLNG